MFTHASHKTSSPPGKKPEGNAGINLVDNRAGRVAQRKIADETVQKRDNTKVNVNNDSSLEKEADVMGAKAMQLSSEHTGVNVSSMHYSTKNSLNAVVQRVETIPVNKEMSQELIDPGQSTAKTYAWQSSFFIHLYNGPSERPHVQVVIRIATPASASVFSAWNASIAAAWNYKFAIRSGAVQYPVTVEIEQVHSSDPFKNYDVLNVKQDVSHGVRGLFGTESMTTWGEADTQDIPHEVGHMLGNADEYGTVNGVDMSAQHDALKSETHSIMFKGDEPPRLRHFSLILEAIISSGKLHDPRVAKYVPVSDAGSSMSAHGVASSSSGHTVSTGSSSSAPGGKMEASSSGSGMGEEIASRMHELRVKKITKYVTENIGHLSDAHGEYLASLNWADDPLGSQKAVDWLGL